MSSLPRRVLRQIRATRHPAPRTLRRWIMHDDPRVAVYLLRVHEREERWTRRWDDIVCTTLGHRALEETGYTDGGWSRVADALSAYRCDWLFESGDDRPQPDPDALDGLPPDELEALARITRDPRTLAAVLARLDPPPLRLVEAVRRRPWGHIALAMTPALSEKARLDVLDDLLCRTATVARSVRFRWGVRGKARRAQHQLVDVWSGIALLVRSSPESARPALRRHLADESLRGEPPRIAFARWLVGCRATRNDPHWDTIFGHLSERVLRKIPSGFRRVIEVLELDVPEVMAILVQRGSASDLVSHLRSKPDPSDSEIDLILNAPRFDQELLDWVAGTPSVRGRVAGRCGALLRDAPDPPERLVRTLVLGLFAFAPESPDATAAVERFGRRKSVRAAALRSGLRHWPLLARMIERSGDDQFAQTVADTEGAMTHPAVRRAVAARPDPTLWIRLFNRLDAVAVRVFSDMNVYVRAMALQRAVDTGAHLEEGIGPHWLAGCLSSEYSDLRRLAHQVLFSPAPDHR